MKSKLLTMALLLMCMSVGAQVPEVSISGYCYQNKKTIDLRSSGENNGHTWVNLGFGSLWATVNVGAENPEDYGNFYAWGETAPKDEYSWTTYKYCNGSGYTMTKYCMENDYGTVDNKVFLDIEDDAAHVNWQGDWQLPSRADLEELYKQCTWVDTTLNGVNVYKAIGPNGNYIYLPKTGWYANNECLFKGERICYWSAELYMNTGRRPYISECGFALNFASPGAENPGSASRRLGCPVRPVCKSTTVSSSDCILTLYAGGCDEPNYVYCAKGQQVSISAIAIEENKMHFARWSDGNTDMPRLLTVDQNITLTAIYEKDYTITVKGEHGGSSMIGGKRYKPGEVAVVEFIPDLGYHFVRWDDGSTENPRRVVMTQDTIIYGYAETYYDGQCGDNLSWKYSNDTLTITGTGAMYDYTSSTIPWLGLRDSITEIVISDGCTSVGSYAFYVCTSLKTLTSEPATPMTLGNNALEADRSMLIYVHMSSVEAYKQQWSAYAGKIYPILSESKQAAIDSVNAIINGITNAEVIAMANAAKQEINNATSGPELEVIFPQLAINLTLVRNMYNAGKKDGIAEGETQGYNKGNADGYNKGKADGITEGETQGYNKGKADGYNEGKADGITEGETQGYNKGNADGYNKGKSDGITEGYTQGYAASQATLPTDPEGTAGTQVVITKDAKTLTLINPDKVKYTKGVF